MSDEFDIEETEEARGTFFERFLWIFLSPKKLYEEIAVGVDWWQPLVWVSLVNMITAYLLIPVQIKLASLNPDNVPPEQLQQTIETMEKLGYLGLISAPVAVLFSGALVAGISYLILSVISERSSFKKYFTLYLYSSIIMSLGILLSTVLTRMKGLDAIRSMEDAFASFGPAMLIPTESKILTSVLTTLDIFNVWFYILIGMGVAHIFKVSSRAAVVVVLPVWLVFVLFSLVGARVAG